MKNEDLIKIIEENLHFFYSKASLNNNFKYEVNKQFKYIFTRKCDWPNTIFFTNYEEANLVDNISEIKTKILAGKLPNSWTVGPLSNPNGLGNQLERYGFTLYYQQTGMALILGNLTVNQNSDLVVHKVKTNNDTKHWIHCVSEVFGIHVCRDLINDFVADEDISLYIGICKDKTVSTLLLCLSEGSAGLHAVTTLEGYRGRDYALTISEKALLDAEDLGYKCAVLQASSMGFHVYQKLGFKSYCKFNSYHLD